MAGWTANIAGLGDPVQRARAGRPHQHPFTGRAAQARQEAQGLSRPAWEEGPIPAVDGVVRWRACDLICACTRSRPLRSDHIIYRALKDLGFWHVSARPKAYKQDDAMEAFKKTLPAALRKSARSSRRARR